MLFTTLHKNKSQVYSVSVIAFGNLRRSCLSLTLMLMLSRKAWSHLYLIIGTIMARTGFSSLIRPTELRHHNRRVVPLARISLTLSRYFFLSFIASGRSSGLHPVSSHNCCMYVGAGRPAFAWPYAGVHRSTSLKISSLLLQQCPACLVRLAWIVFVMGGRWPYSCFLVVCCLQHLFNIARSILL